MLANARSDERSESTRGLGRREFLKGSALTAGAIAAGTLSRGSESMAAEEEYPTATSKDTQAWRDMRFGMFIHWGPVSLKGTEIGWSRGREVPVEEYDQLYREFNPVNFDAQRWIRTAKDAGMKYIVFVSKHHDGFCLWDTKYTDYNIMKTPFGRDVLKELMDACREEGIVPCLYHSICDWRHPDYPLGSPGGRTTKPAPNMDRYVAYLKDQLAEIVRNYGPLGVLWFDGEWGASTWRGDLVYVHLVDSRLQIVTLPAIPQKIVRHKVLTGGEVEVRQTATNLVISLAGAAPQSLDRIVALKLDRPVKPGAIGGRQPVGSAKGDEDRWY